MLFCRGIINTILFNGYVYFSLDNNEIILINQIIRVHFVFANQKIFIYCFIELVMVYVINYWASSVILYFIIFKYLKLNSTNTINYYFKSSIINNFITHFINSIFTLNIFIGKILNHYYYFISLNFWSFQKIHFICIPDSTISIYVD